jgi:hypothetical protein
MEYICLKCNCHFLAPKSDNSKFCSGSCRSTYVNLHRDKSINEKIRKSSLGRICSPETRLKLSLALKGKYTGKMNGRYIDGRSNNYSIEFYKIREDIKKRDDYICQNCGMTEEEHIIVLSYGLTIHHIDYDRDNNIETNLITTCSWCNLRANKNRQYWLEYYKNKVNLKPKIEKKENIL